MKSFSVASFNLYNLNLPGLEMYEKPGWTQEQYDKKIDYTQRTLLQLNADVIGFQELWHADALEKVFSAPLLKNQFNLLIPPNTTGKGIVCAAAVRKGIEITDTQWIKSFPDALKLESVGGDAQTPPLGVNISGFSRPVLSTKIKLHPDEEAVSFYVCHFKSKGPTKIHKEAWYVKDKHAKHADAIGSAISTVRRTAEAAALRVMLNEQTKNTNTPVILVGDINDGQNSNTQNILTGQPQYLFDSSVGGGDTDLYSAQILQEYRDTRDVLYTYDYQGMKESLDHIMVSREFYHQSKNRIWTFDGLLAFNDHLNVKNGQDTGSNDHGIISAKFIHKPAKT
jgi:hypothetical protein